MRAVPVRLAIPRDASGHRWRWWLRIEKAMELVLTFVFSADTDGRLPLRKATDPPSGKQFHLIVVEWHEQEPVFFILSELVFPKNNVFSKKAHAKINLGLHILRKRPDGFHALESVFLKIGWHDDLQAVPDGVVTLSCSDPVLPTDEGNLVYRAAVRLREQTAISTGARLHLDKHVPYEAGLGGGSSDAATALLLLAKMWGVEEDAHLFEIGAAIGSDVPFFLGEAAAFVQGRGEILEYLPEYHFPFNLVVVKPPVSVSTKEAFQNITPREEGRVNVRSVVLSNDLDRWRTELVNDFEDSIFPNHPELKTLKDEFYESGARYASMSGSGSAIYGVYDSKDVARTAADRLATENRIVWTGGSA